MARSDKEARIFESIAQPSNRSSLFWWMVEHHDDMVSSRAGRRMNWKALCARFADLGLTDVTGKPANLRSARQTWERARKEKARLEQWRAENEAARAAKEVERSARLRMREAVASGGKAEAAGLARQWPAPIVAREDKGHEVTRLESNDVGVPARVAERETISRAEYMRRRNERGPDGLLTEEAMRLRDRESRAAAREADSWMGLKYKDEEEGPIVEG